ncbi:ABC transporter ATP-binding protein [Modestobacter sp. VKM Ac-2983]|uniref:ABC transporter ATP-binding protein n=1 Tax=Modestobacter sp. VKM Ac-2983 TaxID=3004137 RepID=UPI0022AB6CE7|nr:ABC transporter ATP-binding protein [Modestobacter sp. VKM Ac-2983]MCZ2806055.1 ABC transporter ATP-binding protein [Modestobacter sp. VKM Ac-2983]
MHPSAPPVLPPATVEVAPAIEVRDLRRSYGAFEAVRGVSFEVNPGEVLALLGVNGAGKTSALEVLEGLADAGGGTVRVLGMDPVTERARVRPHLGVLLQSSGLPGDLTVAETLRTWAGTLTAPRPVEEALTQVGLTGRADVRVRSLSGGERRRLDLALALLGRPDVVVLDEPTTGLDPESRRQVWELVQGLVADGAAVLLTTHHLEEAEELADRVAIMRGGQIVLSGTQAEIAETQPATIRFTLDDDAPAPPVPAGAQVVTQGRRVEWHTRALQPVLAELLAWAAEHGVVLRTLLARAGSLEQAFLAVADGTDPHPTDPRPTTEENR